MRKRNNTVTVRVNDEELKVINERISLSGMTKQSYLINALMGAKTVLFRYYIDRNKNRENSVAYYLSLMGIETLSSSLYRYGLNMTDIVVKDNAVYDALLSFISDNMEQIVSIYTSEIEAVTCYLKSFDFNNEIIWVINPCGNGRVGQALNCLINDVMSCNCSIKEITALQTIDMNDSIYAQGLLETYISSYGNALNGLKLPINQSVINYINTVLSSRIPRIKSITNENGLFKFNFEDAYPWRYGAVEEIQRGIRDFIIEYEKIEERIGINLNIQAEDVAAVLGQLFEMQDYLKKNIPLILV